MVGWSDRPWGSRVDSFLGTQPDWEMAKAAHLKDLSIGYVSTCQPSMVYNYVPLRLHVKKTWGKKGCSIRFHMFGDETYSETSGSRSSFQYQVYNCIKRKEVVDILLLSQATHKKLRIG